MRFFLLIFCLSICNYVDAQDEGIHSSFMKQAETLEFNFSQTDWGSEPPCPWQSVRLQGYASIQIDIKGSLESIRSIDLGMVSRDLWKLFDGSGRSALEVVKVGQGWMSDQTGLFVVDRNYDVRTHTAWGSFLGQARWVDNRKGFDPSNCPSPCNGWYMFMLPNGMLYAQKQLGDVYVASFVQFLELDLYRNVFEFLEQDKW